MKLLQIFENDLNKLYVDKYLLTESKDNVYIPIYIPDMLKPRDRFAPDYLRSVQVVGNDLVIGPNLSVMPGEKGSTDVGSRNIRSAGSLESGEGYERPNTIVALRTPKVSSQEIPVMVDPNYLNKKMKPIRSSVAGDMTKREEEYNTSDSSKEIYVPSHIPKVIKDKSGKAVSLAREADLLKSLIATIQKKTEVDWARNKAEDLVKKEGGKAMDKPVLSRAGIRVSGGNKEKVQVVLQVIKEFEKEHGIKILNINEANPTVFTVNSYVKELVDRAASVSAQTSGLGSKDKKGEELIQAEKIILRKGSKINPTIHMTDTVIENIERALTQEMKKNTKRSALAGVRKIMNILSTVNLIFPEGGSEKSLIERLTRFINDKEE